MGQASVEVIKLHGLFDQKTEFYNIVKDFKSLTNKRKFGARGRDVLDKLMPKIFHQADQCHCDDTVLKRY